jgi:hypothetical protein
MSLLSQIDLQVFLNPLQVQSKSNLPICVKLKKKKCGTCHIERGEYFFYKKKGCKEGLSFSCIICYAEERKKQKNKNYKSKIIIPKKQNLEKARAMTVKLSERQTKDKYNKDRKKRYQNNPNFRISICLRNRIGIALRGGCKFSSTLNFLGVEIEDFKKYIESLWLPGMNWGNYGVWKKKGPPKWNLDHIKPCASFNLSDPEQQKECFHYSNIRPLWGIDNIKKGHSV